ncbi:MAG: Holliday junction branch migration protein RuvA [Phycisphaeraceae bacterium]
MIARIQGILEGVEGGSVLVRLGGTGVGGNAAVEAGLTYQVLVPAYTAARLGGAIGQPIHLHTVYFIESQGQGTTMIPRLAGFLTAEDRRFYELFTTCKGVGNKRALRAMAMSTAQIAGAIADRDLAMLQSLPEIGRRMAETIVATLSGKVDGFVGAASEEGAVAGAAAGQGGAASGAGGGLAREALEVLVQLGENRAQAATWIDMALRQKERPADVQAVIARVYQLKEGG